MTNGKKEKQVDWRRKLKPLALNCLALASEQSRRRSASRIVATKTPDDPTTQLDKSIEELAYKEISKFPTSVSVYSEEGGYLTDPSDAEFTIILDPVDGTHLALRGLPGASFAAAVIDNENRKIVASCVADYFSGDVYEANTSGSWLNGRRLILKSEVRLHDAFVSTCYGKRSRIGHILDEPNIVSSVFWVSTTGGLLDIAKVATGQIDAYFDTMKGFKFYDIAAGSYVARQAGAVATDLDGAELLFPEDPMDRVKFVVAGNEGLHAEILNTIQRN